MNLLDKLIRKCDETEGCDWDELSLSDQNLFLQKSISSGEYDDQFRTPYHKAYLEQVPRFIEYVNILYPRNPRTALRVIDQLVEGCLLGEPLVTLSRKFGLIFGYLNAHPEFPQVKEYKEFSATIKELDDELLDYTA